MFIYCVQKNLLKIFSQLLTFNLTGITHWQSPNFHSFYPAETSYASIIGEMLIAGLSVIGFNWMASPACEELEQIVVDWLAKLFGLPDIFLHETDGPGGVVLLSSACEAVLIAIVAAKEHALKKIQISHSHLTKSYIFSRLIIYTSDQCNSTITRQALIAALPIRHLKSDNNGCLTGATIEKALQWDHKNGFFPIICIATLGTTGTCAMDKIDEIGLICEQNDIWTP